MKGPVMPMKKFYALALLLSVAVTAPAMAQTHEEKTQAAGGKRVERAGLKELYLGQTIVGKTPKGYNYKTPVAKDGSIAANKRRGAGKLLITEKDEACMQFPELWDGKPMCWRVYDMGGGNYKTFRTDGSFSADVTFEPQK